MRILGQLEAGFGGVELTALTLALSPGERGAHVTGQRKWHCGGRASVLLRLVGDDTAALRGFKNQAEETI